VKYMWVFFLLHSLWSKMKRMVYLFDVHEWSGSWCQSGPEEVYYTPVSSKFMENFVFLNAALVAVWAVCVALVCGAVLDPHGGADNVPGAMYNCCCRGRSRRCLQRLVCSQSHPRIRIAFDALILNLSNYYRVAKIVVYHDNKIQSFYSL
jgi:hypothetical protein